MNYKTVCILSAAILAAFAAPGLSGADHSQEIAMVKAGKLTEGKVSWWGFDKKDSTKAFRAAVNSGAKKLIVENMGSDWIVDTIKLPSDLEIVFKNGVVVRAVKGGFKSPKDCLFDMTKVKNVKLRGEGKVLFVMNKKDYQDASKYKPGEWRHTVGIVDCNHILVENFTMCSSGGDGVYVGSRNCRNVTLKDLDCRDHHRQGFSVTGVNGLYVKNCKFNDTVGTAPECGLDLEPNYKDGVGLQNIVFENCEFCRNRMSGVYFTNNSEMPATMTFRNCLFKDNRNGGICMGITAMGNPKQPGKIEFDNCRVEGHTIAGITLGKHTVPNLKIVIRNCTVDNRRNKKYSGVVLASDSEKDLHGIEIRNLTVIDDVKRPPIVFNSKYANALINPVVENVITKDSKGNVTKFNCAEFIRKSAPDPVAKSFKVKVPDRKNIVPLAARGEIAGQGIRFRENTEYMVYGKAGSTIRMTFYYRTVHKFNKKPIIITVLNPRVPPREDRIVIPFEGKADYTLKVQETGIHRFLIHAGNQTVSVACDAPGQAFMSEGKLYMLGCSGTLYFAVPAGVKKVMVEAGGVMREESSAWLQDSSGKVVAEALRLAGSKLLIAERKDASKNEIWSVRFSASKLFLRVASPLPLMFSTHPQNLLVMNGKTAGYELKKLMPPIVRNGEFRELEKARKDLILKTPVFPKSWSGHTAGVVTTEDHRNHIEFSNMVWSYLNLPLSGGKFRCKLTMSGSGKVIAYLSIFGKKGHSRRAPDFGPFVLTEKPQTFTFTFTTKQKDAGYLFLRNVGKTQARLSKVEIERMD